MWVGVLLVLAPVLRPKPNPPPPHPSPVLGPTLNLPKQLHWMQNAQKENYFSCYRFVRLLGVFLVLILLRVK